MSTPTALGGALARLRTALQSKSASPAQVLHAPSKTNTAEPRVRLQSHDAPLHAPQEGETPRRAFEAPLRPSEAPRAAELLEGLDLSPAERRLFELLHELALHAARTRGYLATPSRIVVHLPALLLALAVGVTDRHLRRVCARLETLGLLAYNGHAAPCSKSPTGTAYSGTLYAVRLRRDAPSPRLRREDFAHHWRDLEGDIRAGKTISRLMSDLPSNYSSEDAFQGLRRWTVEPGQLLPPVVPNSDTAPREAVYALPALLEAHAKERARLIGQTASTIATALKDPHSRRLYCALMHRAIVAEHEGLRALDVLRDALIRVLVDVQEWGELRRPGALLVTRLRESTIGRHLLEVV